jgi:HEAT repeat protein
MSESVNQSESRVIEARQRVRASGPILFLAVLFVAATFLAWYFSWFGREISDADIAKYLVDEKNPRHVQHALLQIQQRLERGDPSVKNWYPQLITLSGNPEAEFRLTVAWVMGFDNQSQEFHQALLTLVSDPQPIVRRNAALALVRFKDATGRQELLSVLVPYPVKAPEGGKIASTLQAESQVARGALLARIEQAGGKVVEVRSPLPGKINSVSKPNGSEVKIGDEILSLNSDEDSVWEALRGLALIGQAADIEQIQKYSSRSDVAERIKQQANLTVKAIQSRESVKR